MDFVFDPSLVLYLPLYQLDGASFVSKDAHGHLCSVTGALWRPNGRYFDGTDDKITIPDHNALDLITDATIEVWLNIDDLSANRAIVARHTNSFVMLCYGTGAGNPQKVGFGKNGVDEVRSTTQLSTNTWYHCVGTKNANLVGAVYINGVLEGTGTAANYSALSDDILIGELLTGSGDFSGLIGEVRIYNRALTPQEIQCNYLATKWRYR